MPGRFPPGRGELLPLLPRGLLDLELCWLEAFVYLAPGGCLLVSMASGKESHPLLATFSTISLMLSALPGLISTTIFPILTLPRSSRTPNETNLLEKGSLFSSLTASCHPNKEMRDSMDRCAELEVMQGST